MHRLAFLLVVFVAAFGNCAHAARIYSLVDYPDLQNGHTLSGTITTTDDAADDGLLVTEEILDWEWQVSDGLELTIGEMNPTMPESISFTEVVGIEIDSRGVYFSHELGNIFKLQINKNINSRGVSTRRLAWTSGFPNFSSLFALSGITGGDILSALWVTELPENQNQWLIAERIPEPSGLALCCALLCTSTAVFRRFYHSCLSLPITSWAFLLVVFVAAFGNCAHAARIYSLVDYPDLQNGHTLSGTITTTDDAPDDGLLATEEILDWEWRVAGAHELSAFYVEGTAREIADGLLISPASIMLPLSEESRLLLEQTIPSSRGTRKILSWRTSFDEPSSSYTSINAVSLVTDVPTGFFISNLSSPGQPYWLIATIVPEPSGIVLCCVLLCSTTVILQRVSYRNITPLSSRLAFLLMTVVATSGSSARAARIYNLVDYPDLQNGHKLSGTITTTDDAADDGLLVAEEILDWEWRVSNDIEMFAGQMHPTIAHSSSLTEVFGSVEIDSQGIYLPQVLGNAIKLEIGTNLNSRGANQWQLGWFNGNATQFSQYVFNGVRGGDIGFHAWGTDLTSDHDRWLIAEIVPEPSGLALCCALLCASTAVFRRFDHSCLSLPITSWAFLLVAFVASSGSSARAARIYNLVDYPDLQNGHTLSGTITTTDDAPDDGLLVTEEIMNWKWEVSNALDVVVGAGQLHPAIPNSSTLMEVFGIQIDSLGIYLPLDLGSFLSLEIETNSNSRGFNIRRLSWLNGNPDTPVRYLFNGISGGDILFHAWGSDLPTNQDRWLVATRVPEPSGLALCCALLCASTAVFRRFDHSCLSLPITSWAFLLVAFVATSGSSAHAARIYNLVDYPDLQNGHTLSGTITTTDDAPDDGLLVAEEILDWEWSISGASDLAVSYAPSPGAGLETTSVQGIKLTNNGIVLPLNADAHLQLKAFSTDQPPSTLSFALFWRSFFDENVNGYRNVFSLSYPGRDSLLFKWNTQVSALSGNWLVAQSIPEPASGVLGSALLCLLTTAFHRYLQ